MVKRSEAFTEWVKRVLEERGVTSARQAEKCTGISYGTIQSTINGRIPSAETVIRFAAAYREDVPAALRLAGYEDIAELWETGAMPRPEMPAQPERADIADEDELIDRTVALLTGELPADPEEREKVKAVIRAMVGGGKRTEKG